MSSSTNNAARGVVQTLYIDDNSSNPISGYACSNVLASNKVNDMKQVFYLDILTSKGTQELAISKIQQELVTAIATRYQISSGIRCSELPVDGSTWIVEFTLQPSDFVINTTFEGCKSPELKSSMDADIQDCQFYQVTLNGSYVGTTDEFRDVLDFLQRTVDGPTLVASLNDESGQSLYETKFQGYPQSEIDDPLFTGSDEGRENLNEPTNLENVQTIPPNNQDRTTITVVGGLLVAGFVIAFCGILYILWRRRQAYIQSHNHHFELGDNGLDKLSVAGEGGTGYPGSNPDLEPYNTSNTDEEDDDAMMEQGQSNGNNPNVVDMSRDSSLYISKDESLQNAGIDMDGEDLPSPTEDGQNNGTMQFDLGNSFKDQLMGLHGNSGGGGTNNQPTKRGLLPNSLFPGMGRIGGGPQSLDGGDSDADSWAQTDGTIGSLELQLEPITAEV